MSNWLKAILAILLAIVLVNDVSRLAATHFAMDSIAQTAGDAAATAARGSRDDPVPGYQAAAAAVASEEATISAYSQENNRVHVRVEGPVTGTVIISPIVSLWTGGGWSDPMVVVKDYERSI
jgi:hypothetical protein